MASRTQLKILQWNCRSFRSKHGVLANIVYSYDVIILCETWLALSVHPFIKDFNLILKCRDNRGGGLAICLKKDIPFTEVNSIFHSPGIFETLSVSISSSLGPLFIIAIYSVPSYTTSTNAWKLLFYSLPPTGSVFLAGDFNC